MRHAAVPAFYLLKNVFLLEARVSYLEYIVNKNASTIADSYVPASKLPSAVRLTLLNAVTVRVGDAATSPLAITSVATALIKGAAVLRSNK